MSTPNESNIIRLPAPWEYLNRRGSPIGQDSGAKRFAPPLHARSPRSGSSKPPRLAALVAAAQRVAQAYECRALVKTIQEHAASKQWSARETESCNGISRRTLARLSRAEGDLQFWLPKLRAGVARLSTQPTAAE